MVTFFRFNVKTPCEEGVLNTAYYIEASSEDEALEKLNDAVEGDFTISHVDSRTVSNAQASYYRAGGHSSVGIIEPGERLSSLFIFH